MKKTVRYYFYMRDNNLVLEFWEEDTDGSRYFVGEVIPENIREGFEIIERNKECGAIMKRW